MQRILVTGSTAYDLLLSSSASFAAGLASQELESLSVAFLAQRFARHHGGTGANIAWNLRLLGENPLLVSTVGDDGKPYLALLTEKGINTTHVGEVPGQSTATAIVATDSSARQITFFHPGADQYGSWPDLSDERDDMAYAIISPRDAVLMLRAADWCKQFKVPYLFDPGQQILAFGEDELRRALEGSAGVVVNEYEWELLRRKIHCTEENIHLLTPLLVVTRGEHGVTYFDANGGCSVPPCEPERVVNPTGAGDAFRAGVLAGLRAGWGISHCVRLGAAMGSFAVEIEGTLLEALDLDQVWQRAQEAYGEELPASGKRNPK